MKINLALFMYDALLQGEVLDRDNFCKTNGLTVRTFYRYLREVEKYLLLKKPEHKVVTTGKGMYCLQPYLRK